MQRRNKAGGIVDRRFGENDPTMTPEEKMLERFTKEKQVTLSLLLPHIPTLYKYLTMVTTETSPRRRHLQP